MRIFFITVILIIVLCSSALSDVIYFKGGGKIEGVIKERTNERIVIDVGTGTMSVGLDEVDRVEEAASNEVELLKQKKVGYEIERGEWAPNGYDDIKMLYRSAKNDRKALREAVRDSESVKSDISQKEKKISELLDILDKKGQELKTVDLAQNVVKYNSIVAEMNSLNARIDKEKNKIKSYYEEERDLSANLARLANRYRSSLQLFKDALTKRKNYLSEDGFSSNEKYFFETMYNKMQEMESDFKRDVVLYTPEGNHVIVDALINNNISARLMVDTGASIVLISTDVAYRLGIEYGGIDRDMEIMMADGRSAKAKPIILESVKVGDAEVNKVQAAILEKGTIGGEDGLLGMSFLSHFVIQVDSASNKLILERVF